MADGTQGRRTSIPQTTDVGRRVSASLMRMAQFGSLIAEHRERLGLSTSRLAELIGRAPSSIRAWEKGRSTPNDAVVVTSLAAVLGIDEVELFRAAGLPAPEHRPHASLEETLSSIAPSADTRQVDVEAMPDQPTAGARHARSSAESKLDGKDTVFDKFRSALEVVRSDAGAGGSEPDQPGARPAPPAAVPVPNGRKPTKALSYMEDVEQRWSYRMRAILTVAGVGLLVVVLGWASSELFSALGDVWDALTAGL